MIVDKQLCEQYLAEKWDNIKWSYSRVNTYLTCPYNWYETYVLGQREGNFYAYTGSAYHKIMEDFYNFYLKGGRLDMNVIKATLKTKLQRRFDKNPFTDRWQNSTYNKLLDSLDYFEIYEDVTQVERLIQWEIDGYIFQGYIDLDAGLNHYDWKSKWVPNKYAIQQNLYLFAKEQVDGIITEGFKIPQYKNHLTVEEVKRDQKGITDAVNLMKTAIPMIKDSLEKGFFVKDNLDRNFCYMLCGSKTCEYKL